MNNALPTADTLSDLATSAACTLVHDPETTLRDVAHFAPGVGLVWRQALASALREWTRMYPARVAQLLEALGA